MIPIIYICVYIQLKDRDTYNYMSDYTKAYLQLNEYLYILLYFFVVIQLYLYLYKGVRTIKWVFT